MTPARVRFEVALGFLVWSKPLFSPNSLGSFRRSRRRARRFAGRAGPPPAKPPILPFHRPGVQGEGRARVRFATASGHPGGDLLRVAHADLAGHELGEEEVAGLGEGAGLKLIRSDLPIEGIHERIEFAV